MTIAKRLPIFLLLTVGAGIFGHAAAEVIVIHAGTLITGGPGSTKTRQSVIVNKGRIDSIQDGFIVEEGAQVIDLSSSYVMPGLIDAHVHLQFGGTDRNQDLTEMEDSVVILRAYSEARKSLMAGFTTLRDMAGDPDVIYGLRDAIDQGYVQGPRIVSAGPAIMPTGGGIIRGLRRDVAELYEDTNLEYPCDGAEDCRKAVRTLVKEGADLIKVVATASITAPGEGGLSYQMTADELQTIVETAHALNVKVSAHAHGLDGVNMALASGVDSIEHGTFGDDSSIKLYKDFNAFLVPTPIFSHRVTVEDGSSIPPAQREKLIRANEHWFSMFGLAYAGDVRIAFGTDTQVGAHGKNAQIFLVYKEAGMSDADIVRSATLGAAELLGLDNEIGTIEVGKIADIIAVSDDPMKDIEELLDVGFVMKSGVIVQLN